MNKDDRHTSDDAVLFKEMQEGNYRALETFFRLYSEELYAYAMGFIHHQGEAEDIVQEVFISLWKNRATCAFSGTVKGYLLRAVKNLCIDYRLHREVERRYQQEVRSWQEEAEMPGEDPEELYRKVQRVIARLPEKCREAFILGCVERLSYQEVARRTGVSVNTVKSQIKTAYRKIRSELDKEDAMGAIFLIDILFTRFLE